MSTALSDRRFTSLRSRGPASYDPDQLNRLGFDLDTEIAITWWRMQDNRKEARLTQSRHRMDEFVGRAERARFALMTLLRLRRLAKTGVVR